MKRPNPTIALLSWLTAAYVAGGIGTWGFGHGVETIYPALAKPAWAPPSPLFGPVWTVLDALLGLAAWRVSRTETPKLAALMLWWTALALTALWPWAFFGLGKLAIAFGSGAVLLLVLVAMVPTFGRHDRLAAFLLLPVVLWVGFLTALSLATLRLNAVSGRSNARAENTGGATEPKLGGPSVSNPSG